MKKPEEKIEDIINYFAISLFRQSTSDEILWDLAKNCISKLGFEDCVIYLLDEERKVLVQKAAYGPKNPRGHTIFQPIEIPLGKGIVGSVAHHGAAEIVTDTTKDDRYIEDDKFRYSEITVPIMLDQKVIGIIDSEHSQPNFFNDRHLRILTLIASLCANKLMWAKAEEEIKHKQKALYETQQKLSEFKLQALRYHMNPHFIFNLLNTIQYFITEKETDDALTFLSLFGKFIRKVLNSSTESFISLADEMEILNLYLGLEKIRFEDRFEYKIETNSSLDPNTLKIPVLLIHPFVEYTLTDGLLNREKTGILKILFEKDAGYLTCRITSEKVENYATPKYYNFNAKTDTWWEVNERIELLNRLYNSNIHINFIGTSIEIHIPLGIASN